MVIVSEQSQRGLIQTFDLQHVELEITQFANGEFKINSEDLNFEHVLVIFPEIQDINNDLIKFLLMLDKCQSCRVIDALIPYIPYSRQLPDTAFDCILKLIKSQNVRYIITFDMHRELNDPSVINVLPHEIFGEQFKDKDLIVVAPDLGSLNRGQRFADYLQTQLVTIDKKNNRVTNIELVKDQNCLIVDDILDSGKTLQNAYQILQTAGAKSIVHCITHDFRKFRKTE